MSSSPSLLPSDLSDSLPAAILARLLSLGPTDPLPLVTQWPNYCRLLAVQAEDHGGLVAIATAMPLHHCPRPSPYYWAPVHAWRTLAQLRADGAAQPLLSLLTLPHRPEVHAEFPQVYALLGSRSVPALAALLADRHQPLDLRQTLCHCIAAIGHCHPHQFHPCLQILMGRLQVYPVNPPALNASLIQALVRLSAIEAMPLMAQAYAARRVDTAIAGEWPWVQVQLGILPYSSLSQQLHSSSNHHSLK